ncbi:molybdenum ABC transporter periplasmic molybdate-binding protein [Psychromonas sp. CNPT3]|uniref:molybdate ABC transporter substrate-binding protein n=1 Tax=Psychromonas sp. CNPT3 TaxID=314282 RepID=UPI00006E4833|nr:molybdate ABC transporter substrate-binding protein [Psychromonas sp. CNPT3]AGH81230.1 molybdenum ABC transporter periplasmic molybdate-binding protein [Psychromonas sp. CNPT3]
MRFILVIISLLFMSNTQAALNICAASNFKVTLSEIVARYSEVSSQKILISSASTGTLYRQIMLGAPFDLFLSADSKRAKLIEQSKQGVLGSRFTYAQGRLAFWAPKYQGIMDESTLKNTLLTTKGRIAIADPRLAPYGKAAKETLESIMLWSKLSYVKGSNIAQTYQFIDSGNAQAGFVALSLLLQNNKTHYYVLAPQSYAPILQQGVLLTHAQSKQHEVQKFVAFLRSDAIQALIRAHGYL